jgi:hypothetical protein
MRAGVSYDRNGGKFVVRRLDTLDAVEERLAGILSRPIKFVRAGQDAVLTEVKVIQKCYVDGREIPCDTCQFVESCPTHVISSLKFCLCDDTLADRNCYEKYIAKNSASSGVPRGCPKPPKRIPVARRKRSVSARQAD